MSKRNRLELRVFGFMEAKAEGGLSIAALVCIMIGFLIVGAKWW